MNKKKSEGILALKYFPMAISLRFYLGVLLIVTNFANSFNRFVSDMLIPL